MSNQQSLIKPGYGPGAVALALVLTFTLGLLGRGWLAFALAVVALLLRLIADGRIVNRQRKAETQSLMNTVNEEVENE